MLVFKGEFYPWVPNIANGGMGLMGLLGMGCGLWDVWVWWVLLWFFAMGIGAFVGSWWWWGGGGVAVVVVRKDSLWVYSGDGVHCGGGGYSLGWIQVAFGWRLGGVLGGLVWLSFGGRFCVCLLGRETKR